MEKPITYREPRTGNRESGRAKAVKLGTDYSMHSAAVGAIHELPDVKT
ncbi:MAG: hypothetical protein H8E46_11925 [FCB group bacterium]|nr:hypothetical protein [FCB group bacterium]